MSRSGAGARGRQIEALALEPTYKEAVGRLCCLKGISTHAARVLVTEIGDFRRFEHPGKLMAYVGLVPSEHSSGGSRRQGPITKAGNSRVRHVLVQAAWSCRLPPWRGAVLKRRQEGQPPDAIAHSWKAQHRLHKVYKRLAFRKNSQIAAVAVARELAGFVWALHAGERGRDRSRAPRRLRIMDEEHIADAERGRSGAWEAGVRTRVQRSRRSPGPATLRPRWAD